MKYRFIFLMGLILQSPISFAQTCDTTYIHKNIPVKNGYVSACPDSIRPYYSSRNPSVIVYSMDGSCDSVFSIKKCEVIRVEKIEGEYVCVVKSGNTFITYSGLMVCDLKKGMKLNLGEFIGNMDFDLSAKKYSLGIIFSNKSGYLSFKRSVQLLTVGK